LQAIPVGQAGTTSKLGFPFLTNDGLIKVKVPLRAYDKDGNVVKYTEQKLSSNSYYEYNGQRFYLNQVLASQYENDVLIITVPRPIRTSVGIRLNLVDTAGHYLPVSEFIQVPVRATDPFVTQEVYLLTKDGVGCIGATNEQTCWDGKVLKYADINVQVKDAETGDVLSGVPVLLSSGQSGSKTVASATTD